MKKPFAQKFGPTFTNSNTHAIWYAFSNKLAAKGCEKSAIGATPAPREAFLSVLCG